MDVSFSAWKRSREESLQLKGESFSFLFDRRYTNRLNRMSRVFFEAYVVATRELAAQEDRFPSLSEIDAKMESGAVYAFKDRLVKNTEFFEEVKISGVSYLVPRAFKFIDASGTYTDLILHFEDGTVVLPTRRKIPLAAQAETSSSKEAISDVATTQEPEPPSFLQNQEQKSKQSDLKSIPESYPSPAPQPPLPFEEADEPQSVTNAVEYAPEPRIMAEELITPPSQRDTKPDAPQKRIAMQPITMILVGLAVLLAAAAIAFFLGPGLSPGAPSLVMYSAYLSNSSNDSYLGLEIKNPEGISNEMEMILPPNIDRSISARGGIVTISHANNTMVKMNSSSDAGVKIYLLGNWTIIPVSLNLFEPSNFDTSLEVHGKDYLFTRKNETLILNFNLTEEGVNFEQSYRPRR